MCCACDSVEHSELVVELAGLRGQNATWQAQATQATHDATQAQHRADKLQQVQHTPLYRCGLKRDALNVQLKPARYGC